VPVGSLARCNLLGTVDDELPAVGAHRQAETGRLGPGRERDVLDDQRLTRSEVGRPLPHELFAYQKPDGGVRPVSRHSPSDPGQPVPHSQVQRAIQVCRVRQPDPLYRVPVLAEGLVSYGMRKLKSGWLSV